MASEFLPETLDLISGNSPTVDEVIEEAINLDVSSQELQEKLRDSTRIDSDEEEEEGSVKTDYFSFLFSSGTKSQEENQAATEKEDSGENENEEDETDLSIIGKAQETWVKRNEGGKGSADKTAADYLNIISAPSASVPRMQRQEMLKTKESLEASLGDMARTSGDATKLIDMWMKETGTTVPTQLKRQLISTFVTYPYLDIDGIPLIILGWELRGEHNINEIKNVLESHKDLITEGIKVQKEFREATKGMVAGFQSAANKMTSTVEKVFAQKTMVPQAKIQVPKAPVELTSSVTGKQSGKLSDLLEARKKQQSSSSSTGQQVGNTPLIMGYNEFMKYMELTEGVIKEIFPTIDVKSRITSFLIRAPKKVWELPNEKKKIGLQQMLANFFEEENIRLKAEALKLKKGKSAQ